MTRTDAEESVRSIEIAGLRLACLSADEVVDHMLRALARGSGGWVITPNVDYARRFASDATVRQLYASASLIVADGVPLLWAARLRGTPLPGRVAGSDLVWLVAERAAEEGRSIYLLGGNPGSAQRAARSLVARWPRLRIAGFSTPQFSVEPTADELAAARIALEESRPDLVYVGLGAPKEERVIAALRSDFPRTWWIGVGVSLSFMAGEIVRAPRWMQRAGLEWVHRLVQEPRRLARRYLIDDLPFTMHLLIEACGRRVASFLRPGRAPALDRSGAALPEKPARDEPRAPE